MSEGKNTVVHGVHIKFTRPAEKEPGTMNRQKVFLQCPGLKIFSKLTPFPVLDRPLPWVLLRSDQLLLLRNQRSLFASNSDLR